MQSVKKKTTHDSSDLNTLVFRKKDGLQQLELYSWYFTVLSSKIPLLLKSTQ